MSRRSFHLIIAFLLIVLPGVSARAAEPSAVATLARKEIAVGEDVDLEVKIHGGSQLRWQGSLDVDGLEIVGPRMESMVGLGSLLNGGMQDGMTLTFSVTATRAGEFTIPSIQLSVDGRQVRTDPVVLTVRPEGAAGAKPLGSDQPALGILDLVMPEGTYYVGQMIPVEIRLSGASNLRWQPEAMPELEGDGFTKSKFPQPTQKHGDRNGEAMDVYVFRTAITPSRAGRLALGPLEARYAALVPRARARRPRSVFDDIFSDPTFAETRHAKARIEARELDIKPLPAAGRPESFSGGVGKFKFIAEGSPARVKVGDPVTMKLIVTGNGNFDRITAPALKTTAGWRTYPPSAEFRAEDEIGIAGTKTFTIAVIPETPQRAMPTFEFSYFDPQKGKYVTLASEPLPLTVEGGVPPPPPPVAVASSRSDDAAPAPAAPAQQDILGLRYESGTVHRSFAPLFTRRAFLTAQAVPATILFGWVLALRLRTSASERRVKSLRGELNHWRSRLHSTGQADADFLENAAKVIRFQTALATSREVTSVDAAAALASRVLDEETKAGVERIFSTRAELLYAGPGGGGAALSAAERSAILATVERFEKSPMAR